MDAREIPRKIFEEFGQDTEKLSFSHSIARLPEGGWLSLYENESDGFVFLTLWRTRERAVEGHGFSGMEIYAGLRDAGRWAYGRGNLMAEIVEFRIPESMNLMWPVMPRICLMMKRAIEFCQSGGIELGQFWEVERDGEKHEEP